MERLFPLQLHLTPRAAEVARLGREEAPQTRGGGEVRQLELLRARLVNRGDKLISARPFHCFSDLQITMEIVFLNSSRPPSWFSSGGKAESAESGGGGGRTGVFRQRQRPCPGPALQRWLVGLWPPLLKAPWGEAEGVQRGRENPAEEGESLSVSGGAALRPPRRALREGGRCLSWPRRGGKRAWG